MDSALKQKYLSVELTFSAKRCYTKWGCNLQDADLSCYDHAGCYNFIGSFFIGNFKYYFYFYRFIFP